MSRTRVLPPKFIKLNDGNIIPYESGSKISKAIADLGLVSDILREVPLLKQIAYKAANLDYTLSQRAASIFKLHNLIDERNNFFPFVQIYVKNALPTSGDKVYIAQPIAQFIYDASSEPFSTAPSGSESDDDSGYSTITGGSYDEVYDR